jgi:hypothetical protein
MREGKSSRVSCVAARATNQHSRDIAARRERGGSDYRASREKKRKVRATGELLPRLGKALAALWERLGFAEPPNIESGLFESSEHVSERPSPEPHVEFLAALQPAVMSSSVSKYFPETESLTSDAGWCVDITRAPPGRRTRRSSRSGPIQSRR